MELAAHYCRLTYEAGFSPICPLLYLPLFLNDSVPEEHKAGIDMRQDMLRRSHTPVSYTHLDSPSKRETDSSIKTVANYNGTEKNPETIAVSGFYGFGEWI